MRRGSGAGVVVVGGQAMCTGLSRSAPIALLAPTLSFMVSTATAQIPPNRDWWMQDTDGRSYACRLHVPPEAERRGVSVLLLGGGSVTDLHWTIPPSYEVEGKVTKVTIDGNETRDADTIALALAKAGFVVMQWSSVHRDDESAKKNPALAAGLPFPKTVELARAALAELRKQPEVNQNRVLLVGHSLGATRACEIADDGVIGMVFLAGAYLSSFRESPSVISAREMERRPGLDADADGKITREELDTWRRAPEHAKADTWTFDQADKDADGILRAWEIAAACAVVQLEAHADAGLSTDAELKPGLRWPADILRERRIPTLAIFGGLDPMSFHGPVMEYMAKDVSPKTLRVDYRAARGHELSEERDGLFGPIDPVIIDRIVQWARNVAAIPPK